MDIRGPLMIEHRLIEKMLKTAVQAAAKAKQESSMDPLFIDIMVDFIRTYADRTHHGKEEDILFRDLTKKVMTANDRQVMQELVNEHVFARKTVAELVAARQHYAAYKDVASLKVILGKIEVLVNFYPEHIKKEDKVFFPASLQYFIRQELDDMLEEFRAFDGRMIHEKYQKVFAEIEQKFK
jgi:hemerythrin-like domain-containing protein